MARCNDCIHQYCCKYDRFFGVDDIENRCNYFKNTADVVEVKHGEWKRVECGTICTNCNRVYDKDFEFSHEKIKTYFKRCPECGAKMDGRSKMGND